MNMIIEYKLLGEPHGEVCAAARMKLDGRGQLTLFDGSASTPFQSIRMATVEWIAIHHLQSCRKAA